MPTINKQNAKNYGNTDDKLIETAYPHIYKNENATDYPYYDTFWNFTTGVGKNINNPEVFQNIKWMVNGQPASSEDIDTCIQNLKKEKQRIQSISAKPEINNYRADYFKQFCNIRIDDKDLYDMYYQHMNSDLPVLRNLINNFDDLSLDKKIVLMDFIYNLGGTRFRKKFSNFIKAINTNNTELMLNNFERDGVHKARNIWTKDMLSRNF